MAEIKALMGVALLVSIVAFILSPMAFLYGLIGGLAFGAVYILMDIRC